VTLSTIKGGAKSRAENIRKKSLLKCPQCGRMNTTKWCSHKCSKAWHDQQSAIRNKAEGERRSRALATLKEAMVVWQGWISKKEDNICYRERIAE
jgi:ATP sulfurylase